MAAPLVGSSSLPQRLAVRQDAALRGLEMQIRMGSGKPSRFPERRPRSGRFEKLRGGPSRYGLPRKFQPLERPVCVAVFMPIAPKRSSGVSRPHGSKKGRWTPEVAIETLPFLLEGVHFSLDAERLRITLAWP